jgi:flagellar biosynthetic protein FlhB
MSEQGAGEKSFAPSAKRREDAAKNGDVLRSQELKTAIIMLIGAAWLKFAGPWVLDGMRHALRAGFVWDRAALESFDPSQMMMALLMLALPPILVLGAVVVAAAFVSQLAFGDGRWVMANLAFKPNKFNPLAGLKRMFGPNSLIELGKGLAKVAVMAAITWMWASGHIAQLVLLGRGNLEGQLTYGWDSIISLMFALASGLVLIALIDFPIQLVRRMLRLKMTLQEVRDEGKEAEGSPEKKAGIKRRQRELAMASIAGAMRNAQFVVTNPTHFSVALSYDPAQASAPIVVAKGRGEKALAMRELAAELELPVLEYPALARSLYFTTRERQVIREELYISVAAVLAFVFSLRRGERPVRPQVDVPLVMRFDADGRLDPQATT